MEFDIFIPNLSLAFEYQGEQHYKDRYIFSSAPYKARDKEKRRLAADYGISLVEVPYWWDKQKESLVEMIHRVRPDVEIHL